MTAELFTTPARATDANGNIYGGAQWFFYATGTTTPQAVYANAALTNSLGAVVTSDSGGKFPAIYFDASKTYRGILKSADGASTIHDIDPINTGMGGGVGGLLQLSDWCAGDGSNELTNMQALAAFVNSLDRGAAIYVGRMRVTLSSGTVTFTKPVTFIGEGEAVSQFVFAGSAQIVYSGGTPTAYTPSQFIMDKVGLRVSGPHGSGPLKITFNTGGTGTVPSATLRDSSIQCHADGGSFAYGVWLENCALVTVDNLRIEGDRDTYPITSAVGLKATGVGADWSFDRLHCYFVQTGAAISGDIEGIKANHITMVAVRTGIDWQTSGGGFNPLFTLSDSHINAENRNVYLRGVVEYSIIGCDFYCQNADGSGTGASAMVEVDSQYNGGVSANGRIFGNMFQGDNGFVALASRTGVKTIGRASDAETILIGANHFQSLGKGVDITASTNGVRVLDDNTFTNVTTSVANAATAGANYIAGSSASGTHWSVADNMGNCRKYGTAAVTLDASGNGVITHPTAFSAFRTAMVCSGEPGVASSAAFSVNHASCTASTISFSVRPNPGAVTVRVQYVAEGAA